MKRLLILAILMLAMCAQSALAQDLTRFREKCYGFGYRDGTDALATCMQTEIRIEQVERNPNWREDYSGTQQQKQAEREDRERSSAKYACLARAMGTSTGFGSAGEKFANMAKCNQDVNTEFQAPQIAVPAMPAAPSQPRQVYCYTQGRNTYCNER